LTATQLPLHLHDELSAAAAALSQEQAAVTEKWLKRDQALEWVCVRMDEVRSGDHLANNATITSSRRARSGEAQSVKIGGSPVSTKDCWRIATGRSMSMTSHRGRAIVIGRRRRG